MNVVYRKTFGLLDSSLHVIVTISRIDAARPLISELRISHIAVEAKTLSARESTLVEFKTVQIAFILLDLVKFRQVLADVIAYAEFALRSDYLVIFLIF